MLKHFTISALAATGLASCDGPRIEIASVKLAKTDSDTLRITLDLPHLSANDLIENRHVTYLGAGPCVEDEMVFEAATLDGKHLPSFEALKSTGQHKLTADFRAGLLKQPPRCVLIKTVGMWPLERYAGSEITKIPSQKGESERPKSGR